MKKIAWIGTGVMGAPMAMHLVDAGYEVSAYNRSYHKAEKLEPKIKAYKTIEESIKDADVIFSIVGYPKDVEEVYSKIIPNAKEGAILIDMTTSSPTLAKKLYQEAKAKNLHMLDAPVTGGDLGAINASLSIMIGGDEKIYESVKTLLEKLGTTLTYMGPAGSGQDAKLANQIAIAGALGGIAEALSYAKAKKLNLNKMLAVITGGSASSWQAMNNGPKMIERDFKPGFFLKHLLKDLNLAIEEKGNQHLPLLETVQKIYDELDQNNLGDKGSQAIIKYYEGLA